MGIPLTSIDGTVHWNNSEVDQARGWSLNPSVEAQTYVTNKTNGKVNSRPGNIDLTGSFTVYGTGSTLPCLPGEIADLKLYINTTQYWQLDKAQILDISEEVDIEGGTLQGLTVNFRFAGDADGTGGTITKPDGTEYTGSSVGEIAEG